MEEIDKIPGDFWIRYTSPHPKDFTDDLIDITARSKKISNYIHLPVQSGDNEILKKMNRTYTVEHFEKLVQKLRKKIPDIAITTDTIVGFPSETKKQFENTKKLYKRVGFDMAFISKYSPRLKTVSQIAFPDDISSEEKEKRFKDLTKVLETELKKKNKKLTGQTARVLLDGKKNNKFFGRTEGMKLIEVSGENLKIGEFYDVKITEADAWALRGLVVKPKLLVILGPTASGKTSLSIELAKKFNGEVISADSRQVYKGLDIGTGKVTKREMKGITHYLLDVAEPKKMFDVAKFKKLSDEALEKIYEKNKLPIVCGGTGLYIDAIVKDIDFPDIPQDWKLREKLEKKTAEELFEELKKLDSKRAETIDPRNRRRLQRAIEIIKISGKEVGRLEEKEKYNVLYLGIKREGKELEDLILKRLKTRIKQGMLKEAEREHKKGLSYKRMEALGLEYRYMALFLQGKISKEEMIEQLNIKIRQYAKRQMTWFKRNKNIHWVKSLSEAEKLTEKFLKK